MDLGILTPFARDGRPRTRDAEVNEQELHVARAAEHHIDTVSTPGPR